MDRRERPALCVFDASDLALDGTPARARPLRRWACARTSRARRPAFAQLQGTAGFVVLDLAKALVRGFGGFSTTGSNVLQRLRITSDGDRSATEAASGPRSLTLSGSDASARGPWKHLVSFDVVEAGVSYSPLLESTSRYLRVSWSAVWGGAATATRQARAESRGKR